MITLAPPDGNKPGFLYFEIKGISEDQLREAFTNKKSVLIPSKKRQSIRAFQVDHSLVCVCQLESFEGKLHYRVIKAFGHGTPLPEVLYFAIGSIRENQLGMSLTTSTRVVIPENRITQVSVFKGLETLVCTGKFEPTQGGHVYYRPLNLAEDPATI